MLKPAFGPFHQIAWVTNDLDRSLAQFREVYGVPSFFVMDQQFDARVAEERGVMKLRIALANVDGVELELIEPVGGIDAIYREVLPKNSCQHVNVFHHICIKVCGTLGDWQRHLADLHPQRKVHYEGDIGAGARFMYTDERALLGHYVEYSWFDVEVEQHMRSVVPHYLTTAAGRS